MRAAILSLAFLIPAAVMADEVGPPESGAGQPTEVHEAGTDSEFLPDWKIDIGSSFSMYGWDGGPFKIGDGTVQAMMAYKILSLGQHWDLQAGWAVGTVWSDRTLTEINQAEKYSVSGPTAGVRYMDVVGANLFAANMGGGYWDARNWAIGVNVAVNPAKVIGLAGELWPASEPANVAWLRAGVVEIAPGVYRRL